MNTLFPDSPPQVSIDLQIKEVEREISLREHVYNKRVVTGQMSQQEAHKHITRMRAILATLLDVKAFGIAHPPPPTEHHGPDEVATSLKVQDE